MLVKNLYPIARVAAVWIDGELCDIVGVQLVDYILQGNHAVFEHPIPGVLIVYFTLTMPTVVQIYVLTTTWTNPSVLWSFFDLR